MASPVAQKYCWLNPPSCWWIKKDRKGTSQRTSSMPRVLRQEFPKHPEIHINSHYTVYPHCTTIFAKLSHVESCEIMSNHHNCAAKEEKTFACVWKWGTWNAIFYLLYIIFFPHENGCFMGIPIHFRQRGPLRALPALALRPSAAASRLPAAQWPPSPSPPAAPPRGRCPANGSSCQWSRAATRDRSALGHRLPAPRKGFLMECWCVQ